MAKGQRVRDFLISQVRGHPRDLVKLASETLGISRQAVNKHVRQLVDQGILKAKGTTKSRKYELALTARVAFDVDLTTEVAEDEVWRERILPYLTDVPEKAMRIAEYAFTEMVNNAIDHSAGTTVHITLEVSPATINIVVEDDGIGVFYKIQTEFNLADERHAVLELAKGKVTTDPGRHTGEGIFFTSRAVDEFGILSGRLYFGHLRDGEDWLLEDMNQDWPGTTVTLVIDPATERTMGSLFERFAFEADDFGFTRTVVPVSLLRYGVENLVSRSQAKRLLARFERFKEVMLDFQGVETIGQAFADEIFRVFRTSHPDVNVRWMRANPEVQRMISRAQNQTSEVQYELLNNGEGK